jgi:hypothetical protein
MSFDWSHAVQVAQLISTVGGLLLVWWKVKQIREVNAYELLRDEVKRFNSPEMRACCARLAHTLRTSRRDFKSIEENGEEVCGYFEDIGLLLRRRIVPAYFLWSMLGEHILCYGQLLRNYLVWVRQSTKNPTYYEDFDSLINCLAALEKKRTGLEEIRREGELHEFLEAEAKMADSAAVPKRPGRRLAVACPHCRHPLAIRSADAAGALKCPACSGTFTLQRDGGAGVS